MVFILLYLACFSSITFQDSSICGMYQYFIPFSDNNILLYLCYSMSFFFLITLCITLKSMICLELTLVKDMQSWFIFYMWISNWSGFSCWKDNSSSIELPLLLCQGQLTLLVCGSKSLFLLTICLFFHYSLLSWFTQQLYIEPWNCIVLIFWLCSSSILGCSSVSFVSFILKWILLLSATKLAWVLIEITLNL